MKAKKIFNIKNLIVVVVLAAIVAGFYHYTSKESSLSDTIQKEYDVIQGKDIGSDYPETPYEVVKLYCRIVKCFYSGELSEEKLEDLVDTQRILFSEDLLENNTRKNHIKNLKSDIESYENDDKSIINYKVDSDSVETSEVGDAEYATVSASFTVKTDSSYEKTYEKFSLEKDSTGWKIVSWELDSSNDNAESE